MDQDRPMWHSAKAFVLAVVGAGSGFGAFFRLPYMFHRFGGGTFLIAYVLLLILVAWPLTLVELLIGQHFRKGAIGAWEQVNSRLHGLGYAAIAFCSALVAVYFSAVLSWTIRPYLVGSFANPASYASESAAQLNAYFEQEALYNNGSNWAVWVSLAAVWAVVFILCLRGVSSVAVSVYFTVPIPLMGFLAMTIYALTLPGAANSLSLTMTPGGLGDFFHLDLWAHALGQSLLTMQAATGVLVAFGSYARPVHNCLRISVVLLVQAVVSSVIFALCAAACFGVLHQAAQDGFDGNVTTNQTTGGGMSSIGFPASFNESDSAVGSVDFAPVSLAGSRSALSLANDGSALSSMSGGGSAPGTQVPIVSGGGHDALQIPSGLQIALIIYPALFTRMSWGNGWAVVFFLCVLALGLQTIAALVQSVFTVLRDHFMHKRKVLLLLLVCVSGTFFAAALCLREGYSFLIAIDTAVVSIVLPMFAFIEAIGIGYLWSERSILEVARERPAVGLLRRAKVLFVVAYQHSVGRIQELLAQQGHNFWGKRYYPFLIKIFVMLMSLVCFISGFVYAFRLDSTAEIVVAVLIPLFALITVIGFGLAKKPKKTPMPLTDDDLVLAHSGDSEMGLQQPKTSTVSAIPMPGSSEIQSWSGAGAGAAPFNLNNVSGVYSAASGSASPKSESIASSVQPSNGGRANSVHAFPSTNASTPSASSSSRVVRSSSVQYES